MRALVTGANGFLGRALTSSLLAEGHSVRCLVRREVALPAGAVAVLGNLDPAELLLPDLRDLDVVFHCAAATRKGRASKEELFRVNRDGAKLFAEACAVAQVQVVLASSLAAVGPPPRGEWLDEDAPCRPLSAYGESKLATEHALREAQVRRVCVRLPGLYGPGDLGLLPLFRAAARHLRPAGGTLAPLLHVRDAVSALLAAVRSPDGVLHAAGDALTVGECGRAVASALGAWALPLPLTQLAWVVDPARARELAASWRVRSTRLRALGWTQTVSFEEGARELAAAYRAAGLL